MNNAQIVELAAKHVMDTYARYPLALVKGKGMRVWDADGRQYLDFLAGIAVNCLGHCHPALVEAIATQAGTLLHVSNLYHIETQAKLAQKLCALTFADKVFFGNSGAEANEGAIKLTRKYHHDRGNKGRFEIISATQSFHGRTLATLTATGQEKVKIGYAPLPAGFSEVPFDDLAALEKAISASTAGVILEPIQAEGGIRVPSPGYLKGVKELCDKHGILLIFDEVQTGVGRTGTFLACEAEGVTPHIATLAKGLGGGVPIGALLATDEVAKSFGHGSHASTFGGNPLSTAAALAVLDTIASQDLLKQCSQNGAYFMDKLKAIKSPFVVEVRGRGLLIGVEIGNGKEAGDAIKGMMERGFLVGGAGPRTMRLAPPLVVEKQEIDALVAAFKDMLSEWGK